MVLSAWGERVAAQPLRREAAGADPVWTGGVAEPPVDFAVGLPDLAAFPTKEWNRSLYAAIREPQCGPHAEANQPLGSLALREAVARHLRRSRAIDCEAEQFAITGGSMQAIALLAQILVGPGDRAVVEDPGYTGARSAVEAAGGLAHPAGVDEQGIVPQPWDSRLLFVTPGRQFPTGAALGLQRRSAILRWAEERGGVIVEDDYDSGFRHKGKPIEPLKALDREGRVVFISTFSKTMPPDLRLGYVVLPSSLIPAFTRAKQLFEPHPAALLEQRALAFFMDSGQYERHLRRMKRIYGVKFTLLRRLLREELSHLFDWVDSDAGLHLFGWWIRSGEEYEAFVRACALSGVSWVDGDAYCVIKSRRCGCFGFAHLTEQQLQTGVERMMEAAGKLFN